MLIIDTQTVILDKNIEPTLVKRFEDGDDYTIVAEEDNVVTFKKTKATLIPFPDSFYKID